ncbi:MAG TPA: hypothetical protein VI111_08915 [Thermoleophilaceae bacterium]
MTRRGLLAAIGAALALLACPALAQAASAWQAVPMPIPPGGLYRTPLGLPGDLSFWSPNRGLMTVGGNNSVSEGLYSWDGVEWHQLAVVCGGAGDARIAWAGPTEFWTVSRPSLPRPQFPGLALCHFKDGEVVGSYSAPEATADPYHELAAAACRGPNDCWFGGIGARDGNGQRVGAFHLHWDGNELRSVYNPQGRAVSDLLVHGGELFESTLVGKQAGTKSSADLADPEDAPRLLHRITGETFANDPFVPASFSDGGTELRALDGDDQTAWAVGGGAVSGPATTSGLFAERPPLAARLEDDSWQELTLSGDQLGDDSIFADVAAVPGTLSAWAVVRPGDVLGDAEDLQPSVAHIGESGETQLETLAGPGEPAKGAAWRIACPATDDCWLATARGYLYRLVDPTAAPIYPRDEDPAFQGTITVRPNEAAEQAIPDAPPEDDSLLLAPPVEVVPVAPPDDAPPCTPLPSLVSGVKARPSGRTRLVVRFKLRRRARVALVARRGKRVVARTRLQRLRAGHRSLTLRVRADRWPTRLRFVVRGDKRPRQRCRGEAGSDPDAISTRATSGETP